MEILTLRESIVSEIIRLVYITTVVIIINSLSHSTAGHHCIFLIFQSSNSHDYQSDVKAVFETIKRYYYLQIETYNC